MLSNAQKAVLHVAKTRLGWDEQTYRDVLRAHGGADSSRDLTRTGFLGVMKHAEKCGFVSSSTGKKAARRMPPPARRPGFATDKQIRKIYKLWWLLEGSYYRKGTNRKALREFLHKRFRVSHENFLTFDQADKVIEAVKAICGRHVPERLAE